MGGLWARPSQRRPQCEPMYPNHKDPTRRGTTIGTSWGRSIDRFSLCDTAMVLLQPVHSFARCWSRSFTLIAKHPDYTLNVPYALPREIIYMASPQPWPWPGFALHCARIWKGQKVTLFRATCAPFLYLSAAHKSKLPSPGARSRNVVCLYLTSDERFSRKKTIWLDAVITVKPVGMFVNWIIVLQLNWNSEYGKLHINSVQYYRFVWSVCSPVIILLKNEKNAHEVV